MLVLVAVAEDRLFEPPFSASLLHSVGVLGLDFPTLNISRNVIADYESYNNVSRSLRQCILPFVLKFVNLHAFSQGKA